MYIKEIGARIAKMNSCKASPPIKNKHKNRFNGSEKISWLTVLLYLKSCILKVRKLNKKELTNYCAMILSIH